MSFVYSTGLASFLLLVYGIFRVLKTGRGDVMFFHEFTALYDQHPVYFAIYCAMSVFIATHYYSCFSRVSKLGVIAINLLLGVVLLLTSSKAILLVFAVLYPIQLALYIKNAKMRLISIFALLTLGILSVINIPFLQERFVEGLTLNYTSFQPTHDVGEAFVFGNDDKHNLSDLDLRYIFWRLALFHLNDDGKLLLGYGVGDVQDHLDLYYMYYGLAPGWFEGYNVHNQYLQILASMGILGLLLFCFYLWKSVTVANRNKSFLHLAFLGTMLFAFCFESYLSRNKGIVLFVFFNTLLIKDYYLNEIRDHRNQGDTK
ncbi:O-antigen ligase family protein [Robertkochia flava]|uniref:O-antigen ligase family protein n=1 Tax=Robertkochia flava TaxID=3447986 RepID=UPI001CD01689|nr:O-antigen ligase family protein [Robertkochia marina]